MEMVLIEKRAFDEICNHLLALEEKVNKFCSPHEDLGLKKWLDNQQVCDIMRISKRTLQVYRDKGLIPFSRIKHKIFYKPEDVEKQMQSNYYPPKPQL